MSRGCRIELHNLPKHYQEQATGQLYGKKKNSNGVADSDANMEQGACNEPVAKEDTKGHDTQACSIHIHSIRKRLTDPDGCCGKYAIDGLVHAKILADDTPKFVKEVSYSQEKGSEEKTIITLDWDE